MKLGPELMSLMFLIVKKCLIDCCYCCGLRLQLLLLSLLIVVVVDNPFSKLDNVYWNLNCC